MLHHLKYLSEKYDELYDEAQKVLDKHNPCQVKCGKCLSFRTGYYPYNFCCKGCKHLGSNGCTVKALACKLWICGAVAKSSPETVAELSIIAKKALKLDLLIGRASKEETLSYQKKERNEYWFELPGLMIIPALH